MVISTQKLSSQSFMVEDDWCFGCGAHIVLPTCLHATAESILDAGIPINPLSCGGATDTMSPHGKMLPSFISISYFP